MSVAQRHRMLAPQALVLSVGVPNGGGSLGPHLLGSLVRRSHINARREHCASDTQEVRLLLKSFTQKVDDNSVSMPVVAALAAGSLWPERPQPLRKAERHE